MIGPDIAQFLVPDALLTPGTYIWQVQAACSTVPPYDVTPISAASLFAVAGPSSCPSSVTDIEGNVYTVVEAGGACWMAENLKTRTYSDGSAIPDGPWNTLGVFVGARAFPNGDSLNINGYGMLYNWYAVEDARGICPTGWHVPNEMEWDNLVEEQDPFYCPSCIGFPYSGNGGNPLKSSITDLPPWNGTNLSGFSALPAGWRNTGTSYIDFGNSGVFWTATPQTISNAYYRLVFTGSGGVSRGSITKRYGHSVRCVQD